jgi:hypothetical protein
MAVVLQPGSDRVGHRVYSVRSDRLRFTDRARQIPGHVRWLYDGHTPGYFFGKPDMSHFLGGSDVGFEIPG